MTLYFTRQQSRDVDRRAIEDYGFSSLVLMENAGRGVADMLVQLGVSGKVAICCGKGNNAGDGYVVARHLQLRGYEAIVLQISPAAELQGDALANYRILKKSNATIVECNENNLLDTLQSQLNSADWIIDSLLGTGATGEPREPLRTTIEQMNRAEAKKLAIDVPSGLNCETGTPSNTTFTADFTCTFVAEKIGFKNPQAAKYLGQIHVLDIGVPLKLIREVLAS